MFFLRHSTRVCLHTLRQVFSLIKLTNKQVSLISQKIGTFDKIKTLTNF